MSKNKRAGQFQKKRCPLGGGHDSVSSPKQTTQKKHHRHFADGVRFEKLRN